MNSFVNIIRSSAAVSAFITWLAVILQLYLIIVNRTASISETIIRFFSFFTILTNILVAVCFTTIVLERCSTWKKTFSKPAILSATTVYILVVGGVVYNIILRFLWRPEGLQQIVDELLHSVIPVLFLLFWIAFVPKTNLQWKAVFAWLLYPLLYLVYVLLRGAIAGFYPYPFIDVTNLGYQKVIVNSVVLCGGFLALSAILIALTKLIIRSSRSV